jgi:hypothetical protein
MFEYFRQNYTWNLALMSVLNRGGAMGEVDEACRPLQEASVRNDVFAQQAWYESWKKLAERVEALGLVHEQAGQYLSAGRKYLRASMYYLVAERMLSHRDPRKVQTYRQAFTVFKKASVAERSGGVGGGSLSGEVNARPLFQSAGQRAGALHGSL